MKVELKHLNVNMAEQEYEMLQGILGIENGFTNPAYNLSYKKYQKWLQEVDNHSRGVGLPKDWIPYTTYVLYIDDIPVGWQSKTFIIGTFGNCRWCGKPRIRYFKGISWKR